MTNPTETYEFQSYGLDYPQPYPYPYPEGLPRNAFTTIASASLVAFTGQGRVTGITVSSSRATGQFIQVFDAASLPANGAVPPISVDIATVTAKGIAFSPGGRWFFQGCVVANSTTQTTLTTGAADCLFDVQYVPQVI